MSDKLKIIQEYLNWVPSFKEQVLRETREYLSYGSTMPLERVLKPTGALNEEES